MLRWRHQPDAFITRPLADVTRLILCLLLLMAVGPLAAQDTPTPTTTPAPVFPISPGSIEGNIGDAQPMARYRFEARSGDIVSIGMDATSGTELYLFDVGHPEARLSTPAIAGDLFLTAGSNGVLYAVDRTSGELVWSHDSGEAFGGPPLVAGDVVYMADMAESLRAFDLHSGDLLWETELDGRVKSAMAIAEQGLVVLTEPRNVVFFRSEGEHAASR